MLALFLSRSNSAHGLQITPAVICDARNRLIELFPLPYCTAP